MSFDGVVTITTSLSGTTASASYCVNGPWYRRSFTSGPFPQSYFSQLCSGMLLAAASPGSPATKPKLPPAFKNPRRFIATPLAHAQRRMPQKFISWSKFANNLPKRWQHIAPSREVQAPLPLVECRMCLRGFQHLRLAVWYKAFLVHLGEETL